MGKHWLRFLVWYYRTPGNYSSSMTKDYDHYQKLKERLDNEHTT